MLIVGFAGWDLGVGYLLLDSELGYLGFKMNAFALGCVGGAGFGCGS